MFPRQVPGLAFIRFQPVFGSFKIQNSNFFSSSSSFQFLKNNIVPQAEFLRRLCSESLKEGTSLTKFNIPIEGDWVGYWELLLERAEKQKLTEIEKREVYFKQKKRQETSRNEPLNVLLNIINNRESPYLLYRKLMEYRSRQPINNLLLKSVLDYLSSIRGCSNLVKKVIELIGKDWVLEKEMYSFIIKSYYNDNRNDWLYSFVKSITSEMIMNLDPNDLTILLFSFANKGDLTKMEEVVKFIKHPLTLEQHSAIATAFAKNNMLDRAKQEIETMKVMGEKSQNISHVCEGILRGLVQSQNEHVKPFFQYIIENHYDSEAQWFLFFMYLKEQGDVQTMLQYLDKPVSFIIRPWEHWKDALQILKNSKSVDSKKEIFEVIKKPSFPYPHLLGFLFSVIFQEENEKLELFKFAKQRRWTLAPEIYESLIKASSLKNAQYYILSSFHNNFLFKKFSFLFIQRIITSQKFELLPKFFRNLRDRGFTLSPNHLQILKEAIPKEKLDQLNIKELQK